MLLTNRTGVKNTRDLLRAFGGLNETYGCTEAEYSGRMNFSARDFPALSTRLPRRRLQELAGLNGMYHLNGLLTVCGQDLVYTPDEAPAQPVTVKKCRGRQPQDDGGHRNKDPDLPGQGGVRYGRRQCGPAGCCLGSGKPERELCAL